MIEWLLITISLFHVNRGPRLYLGPADSTFQPALYELFLVNLCAAPQRDKKDPSASVNPVINQGFILEACKLSQISALVL